MEQKAILYRQRHPDRIKEQQDRYNKLHHDRRLESWRNYRIKNGLTNNPWYPGKTNKCKICEKLFVPPKNRPYQEYCGDPNCIRIKNNLKAKLWHLKHKQ